MTRIKVRDKEATFVGMGYFENYPYNKKVQSKEWGSTSALIISTTGMSSIHIYAESTPANKVGIDTLHKVKDYIYQLISKGAGVIDFTPIYNEIEKLTSEHIMVEHNVWNSRPSKQEYRYYLTKGIDENRGAYEKLFKLEYPIKLQVNKSWHSDDVLSVGIKLKLAGQKDASMAYGFIVDPKSFEGSVDSVVETIKKGLKKALNEVYANRIETDVSKIIAEQMAIVKYKIQSPQHIQPAHSHW